MVHKYFSFKNNFYKNGLVELVMAKVGKIGKGYNFSYN
jgi:hypothetical protein